MNFIKLLGRITYLFFFNVYFLLIDASMSNNLVYSQDHTSFTPQSSVVCTENDTYAWCLPPNYKRDAAPWIYRHLTNTTKPWNYHFNFYIYDVHEIDERFQTLKISMYCDLTWHEPRLRTNKSANEWREGDYISTSTLNSKYFWRPDLDIYGVETSSRQLFMKDLSGILINKQQKILYSLRLDIKLSCQMDFNRYPFDSQKCPFRVSSYFDDDEMVKCTSKLHHHYLDEFARTLQYTISLNEMAPENRTTAYLGQSYSRCGFMVLYTRSKTQLFFQVYLTAGMLVIVSWTSFLINPNIVPGRMGLLVTLFLVLVNIFNGFKNSAPPSINLNALDVYLIICIGHVFFVLIQYAIVLFVGNFCIKISVVTRQKVYDESLSHSATSTRNQVGKGQQYQAMNTFDSASLMLFPLIFILCLVIYVAIYVQPQ